MRKKVFGVRCTLSCIDDQKHAGFIGPLQANRPNFHYVIGISGILLHNRNLTLQTCLSITRDFFRLHNTFARLYIAAASPSTLGWLVGNNLPVVLSCS